MSGTPRSSATAHEAPDRPHLSLAYVVTSMSHTVSREPGGYCRLNCRVRDRSDQHKLSDKMSLSNGCHLRSLNFCLVLHRPHRFRVDESHHETLGGEPLSAKMSLPLRNWRSPVLARMLILASDLLAQRNTLKQNMEKCV